MSRTSYGAPDDHGDPAPVAGGRNPSILLEKLRATSKPRSGDELLDSIQRLLTSHPNIAFEFRNPDSADLDDDTKRLILRNLRQLIGVYPKES
jgi:hypothetical protein